MWMMGWSKWMESQSITAMWTAVLLSFLILVKMDCEEWCNKLVDHNEVFRFTINSYTNKSKCSLRNLLGSRQNTNEPELKHTKLIKYILNDNSTYKKEIRLRIRTVGGSCGYYKNGEPAGRGIKSWTTRISYLFQLVWQRKLDIKN